METYIKNSQVQTEAQAEALLTAQDDFITNYQAGSIPIPLDSHLRKIWNNGTHLTWQWSNESQQEYDQRITQETAEDDKLALLQSDNDHFLDIKIRPWRNGKLREWIDDTYIKPLKYNLTAGQITERTDLHQELLAWPALTDFSSYKTDTEIDVCKISAPSWAS